MKYVYSIVLTCLLALAVEPLAAQDIGYSAYYEKYQDYRSKWLGYLDMIQKQDLSDEMETAILNIKSTQFSTEYTDFADEVAHVCLECMQSQLDARKAGISQPSGTCDRLKKLVITMRALHELIDSYNEYLTRKTPPYLKIALKQDEIWKICEAEILARP